MEKPKTDHIVKASQELGEAYVETSKNIKDMKENLTEVNTLYDHGYGGTGKSLISFGIALVMLPEPTLISDVIGGGIIAAGCLYNKISPPPIFVDDVCKAIDEPATAPSVPSTARSCAASAVGPAIMMIDAIANRILRMPLDPLASESSY